MAMHPTYIATLLGPSYRIVRVFGNATTDEVHTMLAALGIEAHEIVRAPDKVALAALTATLDAPCKVMYLQGKK